MTERQRSEERDWSALLPEILHLISKKLPDISDFILVRAVCKNWRSSAPVSDPPPQLPWILEQPSDRSSTKLYFHTLFTSGSEKTYNVNCPKYIHKFSFTASRNYMLTFRHDGSYVNTYSLLNPFTNNEISLGLSERLIYLSAVESDPKGNGTYLILSMTEPKQSQWNQPRRLKGCTISFRQLEDPKHVLFEMDDIHHAAYLCYNGEYFYLEELRGITKVTDIASQKLSYEIPAAPNYSHSSRFVKLFQSNGEIFQVRTPQQEFKIDIYQLNLERGKAHAHWDKVDSIGDRIVFLVNFQALCFNAQDYPVH